VLIAVERLLLRIRQPASRADELLALRRRVRAERAVIAGAEEREAALAIRALKLQVAEHLVGVTSCHTCSTGKPWPRGAYAGGDCCGGVTTDVFDDGEVAALAQAGTRPTDLNAPRGEHPGCAFRGPLGCTLATEHRPGICLHYVCGVLRQELGDRGDLETVDASLAALDGAMQRFLALREERLDEELLAPLEQALST
jgi:hypothetical protein